MPRDFEERRKSTPSIGEFSIFREADPKLRPIRIETSCTSSWVRLEALLAFRDDLIEFIGRIESTDAQRAPGED